MSYQLEQAEWPKTPPSAGLPKGGVNNSGAGGVLPSDDHAGTSPQRLASSSFMIPLLADSSPTSPTANALTSDVTRAQRGDAEAFERIYRQHAPRVNALCWRLAGDATRAEELLQDVFVRAWERLASFRGESSLESWLHRVTVNVFLAANRSDKRRRAHEDVVEDSNVELPAETAPRDVGTDIDLEQAISRLSPGARMAFVMHDIEGYSHDEIAAMSGIAAATVRVQLHRARRQLMEALS